MKPSFGLNLDKEAAKRPHSLTGNRINVNTTILTITGHMNVHETRSYQNILYQMFKAVWLQG